jgi:hypothetical protein
MEENPLLKKEVEAYQMAQSLLGFSTNHLSEEEILEDTAEKTAVDIIQFAALNLSEEKIIEKTTATPRKEAKVRLMPFSNQKSWLVAASAAFILSLFGLNYWNASHMEPSEQMAKVEIPKVEEIQLETPVVATEIAAPELKEEETVLPKKEVALQEQPAPKKKRRVYPKAKKRDIIKVVKPIEKIAQKQLPIATPSPLLAMKTSATEIASGSTINNGEKVTYTAENVITLKPGFFVEAGSEFTASSKKLTQTKSNDFTTNSVISKSESVIYKANNSITLAPGFHAKVGSGFIATVVKNDD